MSTDRPMGKLIPLPVEHRQLPDTDPDAPSTSPGADGGSNSVPPTASVSAVPDGPEDDGDALEGTVLVDAPDTGGDVHTRFMRLRDARRRPVIAGWLRDLEEAKAAARWAAGYARHVTAYHAVRVPLYGAVLLSRSPRGALRVLVGAWRWTFDAEGMPLRTYAVDRNDADTYLKLLRERDDRVRWRRLVALAGLAGVVLAAGTVAAAGVLAQAGAVAALLAVLGVAGAPADKPLLGTAVVSSAPPKLTSEVVVRALGSLGIAEINRSVKDGGGITFPAPITRDGPGWRADVDLPYGVTATDIMEKRAKLASGLRRPIGCVWPESADDDEHAGRLVLWVGDQPMSKTKRPAWPLAKTGTVDLFAPAPVGTDQRGRIVTVTLMFVSVIIGAIPRMGKTFWLRLLLLVASLDVRAEIHAYDLKGTGDLSPLAPVAHAYRAGDDEEDIAYALADLRSLRTELRRRTKVIRGLPKDICPESKVTPELASKKSLGLHPIVIGVDECQVWFEHSKHGAEFEEICTDLVKRGPAVGIVLILATQRPDAKSLPTGISANAVLRICLKVMGHTENDMVLGTSAHKSGIRATMFSFTDKGICYLAGEGDAPRIVAGAYADAPAAETIALRGRALRKAHGTLTGYAAGHDHTPEQADDGSVLGDILAVTTDAEDKIRSYDVVDRLPEYRPGAYGAWCDQPAAMSEADRKAAKATTLAAALKPYGIKTVQVNRANPNGDRENSRGIVRADISAALDNARSDQN